MIKLNDLSNFRSGLLSGVENEIVKIYRSYFSDFSNLGKHEFGQYWRCWVPIKRCCEKRRQVYPISSQEGSLSGASESLHNVNYL